MGGLTRGVGALQTLLNVTHGCVNIKVSGKICITVCVSILREPIHIMLVSIVGGKGIVIIRVNNVMFMDSLFGWMTTTTWCIFGNPTFLKVTVDDSVFQ